MGNGRIRRPQRVLVMVMVWLLVGGSVSAFGGASASASGIVVQDLPDEVEELLADQEAGGPEALEWDPFEEPEMGEVAESEGMEPLEATELPEPGTPGPVEVTLAADNEGGISAQAAADLEVEVLDHAVAEGAGVSAFAFEVSDPSSGGGGGDGLSAAAAADEVVPVELSVDYSGFAGLYGGGWVDRLQVVVVPPCALEQAPAAETGGEDVPAEDSEETGAPELPGFGDGASAAPCDLSGTVVPTEIDREAQTLTAVVEDLAGLAADDDSSGEGEAATMGAVGEGDAGVTFGVTAGVSGESGSFAATPLGVTGDWVAGAGSGEFSYSYDMDVPTPGGGGVPDVGLGYSSGSVDGLTNATNPQAGQAGLGWSDFDGAYIERSYEPCIANGDGPDSLDLCWLNQNGTMSLGDASGTLLPLNADATEWAVHSDAGWKVERLTGADNGVHEGEHWKVTSTDGTEYFFGLGHNPDNGAETLSAMTVPVIADHPEEPCWGSELHACPDMGYRWNLDRVVDPDGNVTTYHHLREYNRYRSLNGEGGDAVYHRSSRLSRIEYGGREGEDVEPAGRVTFGAQYRCNALDTSCADNLPTKANGSAYPDVPNDMICWRSGERPCEAEAPSFFTTKRYSHVRTEVRVDGEWRGVNQYNLNHVLGGRVYENPGLYMRSIQQHGVSQGDWKYYAPTVFNYEWLANRVDVDQSDSVATMPHARIDEVTNPHGGVTQVTYGQNRPCAQDWRPRWWSDNDRDCFPQTSKDDGHRRVGVFHKWLVTQITETPGGDGPAMTTSYEYEDDPAWAYNYGSFAQYDHNWGWSSWRGYETTAITQGDSKRRVRTFRGMNGDPLMVDQGGGRPCPCGSRVAEVETFDRSDSLVDHPALVGQVLEEETYGEVDGQSDSVVESMRYDYKREVTHPAGADQGRDAEWAQVSKVTESVATPSGEFRQRGSVTTYDDQQRPVTTTELGWLDEDDQRCTVTTYAEHPDPDSQMLLYPSSNQLLDGDCETGEVLNASETYYDGSATLGELGDRAVPTRERVQIDGGTWSETTTEYDALGRAVSVTDPEGATSTTSYEAAQPHLIPTSVVETNALGHETTTDYLPEFGQPVRVEDPNGNVTTSAYDALGRLEFVWNPTEQPVVEGTWPSLAFSYYPDAGDRKVRSLQLVDGDPQTGENLIYDAAFAFFDGFWRERQTQTQSPIDGQMITQETTYDAQGQVRNETGAQALEGKPGDGRVSLPEDGWDNRARHSYDALGRPVRTEDVQNGAVVRESTTAYTHDSTTVTDAEGNQTRERLDGFGRTVAVEEHDGDDWVTSTYGFDLADRLTSVSDPEGNQIDYTYNMAGWRLTEDDPNRGAASYGYDQAGRVTSTVDGEGNEVHVAYDALGRQTERHAGAPDGELLASWEYDTAPGGVGMPHREVRPSAEGDWITETAGYDIMSRSEGVTLTVPDDVPGEVGGAYEFTTAYDRTGQVIEQTIPEIGGLPAETLTTGYDDLGYAREMSGLEDYVNWVQLDARGRRQRGWFGPDAGQGAWAFKEWGYDADQMPERTTTSVGQADGTYGAISDHQMAYDGAGNVTDRVTHQNGLSWRECYGYDARYRLTDAFTVDAADDCDSGTPGEGAQPYEHSYTYSPDGSLTERTEDGDTTSYTYPAAGEDRPHAPTAVGDDSYSWDANGNLTERAAEGDTETFSWDEEQRLASVESTGGASTEFFYDASGQRLLRQSDDGTTLYLAGHEVTIGTDGEVADAVRPYSFGGEMVATRSLTQGVQYLVTDQAGSVEMAVDSGAEGVAGTRSYDPYGAVRGQDGDEFATDRGFLGQVEDPATSLSYLNQRYYDTNVGVFISTDPIYKTGDQRTLNPYSYAGGNPTTYADPTGLSPSYIYGLEQANQALTKQNQQLGSALTTAYGVIRNQRSYIGALQAHIRQQSFRILALQLKVMTQKFQINRQKMVINALRARNQDLRERLHYVQQVANWQGGVINHQKNTIGGLQSQVAGLQGQVSSLQHTIYHLQNRPRPGSGGGGNPKGGLSGGYDGSGFNPLDGVSFGGGSCPPGKLCDGLGDWINCSVHDMMTFNGRNSGCGDAGGPTEESVSSACEKTQPARWFGTGWTSSARLNIAARFGTIAGKQANIGFWVADGICLAVKYL